MTRAHVLLSSAFLILATLPACQDRSSPDERKQHQGIGQGPLPSDPATPPSGDGQPGVDRENGGQPAFDKPGAGRDDWGRSNDGSLYGDTGGGSYGNGVIAGGPAPRPTPMALQPVSRLPQSGVLASTFVPGGGVQARLDDLLDRGVLVDGQEVRIEAFDPRERLPYAVPATDAVALYAEAERSLVHDDGGPLHLQIALLARQGEAPPRPRMDVRLVLDKSGSMMGDKWSEATAAAHALVDRLQPGDTFGLISFSDDASVDFKARKVGDRKAAHAAIDAVIPGGSTNIGAALDLVLKDPPKRAAAGDLLMVMLVSDGQITVGEANPDTVAAKARRMFDESGVLTTAIGLGTDFDENLMLSVAREGSGSYHFVRRPEDIKAILTDELDARAEAVAQALQVKIVPAAGVIATRVYGSRLLSDAEHDAVRATEVATDVRIAKELGIHSNRRAEDTEGLRIHLPTFRRADQHVILMELTVPAGKSTGVATVTLDYKDLVAKKNVTRTIAVTIGRSADREAVADSVRRTVKRTVLAFQAGEALQDAAGALASGDLEGAKRSIDEHRTLLEAAASGWRDASLAKDAQLLARYERVLAASWPGWSDEDRQTMVMAMNQFGDERMR